MIIPVINLENHNPFLWYEEDSYASWSYDCLLLQTDANW